MTGGDEVVLLHRSSPLPNSSAPVDKCKVSLTLSASVMPEDGDSVSIDVSRQASVDLTSTTREPPYKWSRPLSTGSQYPQRPPTGETKLSTQDQGDTLDSHDKIGVVFTFSAPSIVPVNAAFDLRIQCVNLSVTKRRFTVLHIPTKQDQARAQSDGPGDQFDTAELFLNAMQRRKSRPQVSCFDSDVRIGPLAPDAMFETSVQFCAVSTGPLDLGLIRVLDLDTRRTVDIKELPDVVALQSDVKREDQKTAPRVDWNDERWNLPKTASFEWVAVDDLPRR